MTNSKSTCLTNTGSEEENSSPFYSYEHDQDPIMIAARSQKNVRWKHYSEDNTPLIHQHFDTIPPLNLIALGRTGDGKSSLLNDLMGHQVFEQKISAKSQTKEIQYHTGFWAPLQPYMHGKQDFGCPVTVIDTPGFGDSQMRDKEFFEIIQNALVDTAIHRGGIHCVLMVFKITTNSDTIFKSIEAFYNLVSPHVINEDYWNNVLLVFTHVDIVNGNANRYQSHKMALKTKVNRALREKYNLKHDLPMLWISTQKYTCGFLKGLGDCDCEKGNRYHADCRRRLFEQVSKRRNIPFTLTAVKQEPVEADDEAEEIISLNNGV